MNILIIGGTGFLGRNLVKYIKSDYQDIINKIYVTGHSEYKIALFKKLFSDVPSFLVNIDDIRSIDEIEHILLSYNIDCIINCAAMKHVSICEENIIATLNTNVIFCNKLVILCKKLHIKYLLGISTDKSNKPLNVYGMSKNIMERVFLNNGYQIFQGVNFFGSDGSILDIWHNQYMHNKPLTYTDLSSYRYYNTIDLVCKTIIDNLFADKRIITTDNAYEIKLLDLLEAFKICFNYKKTIACQINSYEKHCEDIDTDQVQIIHPSIEEVAELIEKFFDQ